MFAPCFSIHIDCSTPPGLQHDFIPRFILRSNSPGHTNQTTNINPDTRMKKQATHTDHQSYLTHVTDDRPAGSILLLCYLLKQSSKSSHSNLRLSWSRKLQTTWLHDSEQGSVTVTGYTVTGPVWCSQRSQAHFSSSKSIDWKFTVKSTNHCALHVTDKQFLRGNAEGEQVYHCLSEQGNPKTKNYPWDHRPPMLQGICSQATMCKAVSNNLERPLD